MKIPSLAAAACAAASLSTVSAATVTWTAGGNGNIGDPTKYAGGVAPVNTDTVASDGAGSTIGFDATNTGLNLTALNLNVASGATIFNQTAGTLTVGTLGFGGGGGSRNPTYNLSGGTLNITTSFTWGNGTNARFVQSGGTVNYTGTNNISMAVGGGANSQIILSNNAIFNATAPNIYLGNVNTTNGVNASITLSNTSQFVATGSTLVLGQFNNNGGANQATGTLTLSDSSEVKVATISLGGTGATNRTVGVINLNGGTIETGSIRFGNTSIAASSTQQVLRGNGGTVKTIAHANNANFLQGIYVDLQAGGLNLDTNGNEVGIGASTTIAGTGNFVKQGAGALTILGSKTYTGDTVIEGGSIVLGNSNVFADASDLVLDGGTLALADFSEAFATLNLESTSTIDFGTLLGGANTLTFADSSQVTWSGSLILTNFSIGEDALNFSTEDGLSSLQLSSISLAGYTATGLDSLGNVVFTAVPEPAEISLAIAGGLGLLALVRRRRAARA